MGHAIARALASVDPLTPLYVPVGPVVAGRTLTLTETDLAREIAAHVLDLADGNAQLGMILVDDVEAGALQYLFARNPILSEFDAARDVSAAPEIDNEGDSIGLLCKHHLELEREERQAESDQRQ